MFAGIAPRYDLANHALSLGLDFHWRRVTVRRIAERAPGAVLDVATGSGDLALATRAACPSARVVGSDFCEPMLDRARAKGLTETVVADAQSLPFADDEFDAVTVAFGLRNMEDRHQAVREMARVLRPGGDLLVLDFSLPGNSFVRALYRLYLHRVLPAAAGLLTGRADAYQYLGASIEDFPSGRRMIEFLEGAGLGGGSCQPLTGGIVSLYSARKAIAT